MKRPLMNMGVLFVLGELAYGLLEEGVIYSVAVIIIGILITLFCNRSTHNRCLDLLLFLCLVLGVVWAYGYYGSKDSRALEDVRNSGMTINLEMYIEKLEEGDDYLRLTALSREKSANSKVIIYVKKKDDLDINILEPGCYISVKGKVEAITGRTNPGGMDMEEYYAGKAVQYQIISQEIHGLDKKKRLVNSLYHIRCWMGRRIDRVFSDKDSAILRAMILGDRAGLSREVKLLYQRSGIMHILAISGLHVSLIAGAFEWLLEKLRIRKNLAIVIVIVFMLLYGLMTGFAEATLRAVIMLIVSKVAFLFGRSSDMPTSMIEALVIMIIINPYSILSTGMLMSYSAVLGVITGNMIIKRVLDKKSFRFLKKKKKGRVKRFVEGMIISSCISLWMFPLLLRSYYELPVLSLLLNLIVVPLLTVLIVCGVFAALIGLTMSPFVWVCHGILLIYEGLCKMMIKLPGSIIVTGHIEIWQMTLVYMAMGAVIFGISYVLKTKKTELILRLGETWRVKVLGAIACVFLLVTTLGVISTYVINISNERIVFLDVGQGDGSIIHKRYSHINNYIVDCGSTSNEEVGQYTLIPALKYYAMTHIRCIFISHMDKDHINGVLYLLQNKEVYGIKVDYLAVAKGTERSENYDALLDVLGDTKMIELTAGDVVDESFYVLYPSGEENIEHNGNDYSLVLDYRRDELEILYTGDISSEAEECVSEAIAVTHVGGAVPMTQLRILKCPHHGSKYSCSEKLLSTFEPDLTVISCGKNNVYGHPAAETLERLKETQTTIIRTDVSGAVCVGGMAAFTH